MQSSNLEDKDSVDNSMVMVMKRKETGKEEGSKGEGKHTEKDTKAQKQHDVWGAERDFS